MVSFFKKKRNFERLSFSEYFVGEGRRDENNGSASPQIPSLQVLADRRTCKCVHVKEIGISQRNNTEGTS